VQRILRPYTGAGITITESRARGSQDCGLYIIADYRNLRLACRLAGATKLSARLSRDFRGASRAVGGRSARIGVDPFLNVDSRASLFERPLVPAILHRTKEPIAIANMNPTFYGERASERACLRFGA